MNKQKHEKDQQYRVLSVAVVAVDNLIERVNVTLRITSFLLIVSVYVTVFPPSLSFRGFHSHCKSHVPVYLYVSMSGSESNP